MDIDWQDCLQVRSQISVVDMVAENLKTSEMSPQNGSRGIQWETFMEKAGVWGKADFVTNGFVDHINTTKDSTDYLWYTTRLDLVSKTKIPSHILQF